MSRSLALSSGWHYIMDWTWVISHIGNVTGKKIVDAGAGIGLLQWYLASKEADIISIDRSDRICLPFHLLPLFNVSGYRSNDEPLKLREILNIGNGKARLASRVKSIVRGMVGSLHSSSSREKITGSVKLYNQDLRHLLEIPDNSIDNVVSISALEHNENIQSIKQIIQELERILVPGGTMVITLPAAQKEDWFFSPAYSWCFCESTIRYLFDFTEDVPSNFHDYKILFEKLRNSDELKKNLSWRYFIQPNSGMPWGKWDPRYLPVGVVKTKQA